MLYNKYSIINIRTLFYTKSKTSTYSLASLPGKMHKPQPPRPSPAQKIPSHACRAEPHFPAESICPPSGPLY